MLYQVNVGAKETEGSSPASATCLRIFSALATLTTGPSEVSGLVGSPRTYFFGVEYELRGNQKA